MVRTDRNEAIVYRIAMDSIRQANPTLDIKLADEKAKEIVRDTEPIYKRDKWFYRAVVFGLTLIVVIVLIGGLGLLWNGKILSDGVVAIGSAAAGGLVAIFATNGD